MAALYSRVCSSAFLRVRFVESCRVALAQKCVSLIRFAALQLEIRLWRFARFFRLICPSDLRVHVCPGRCLGACRMAHISRSLALAALESKVLLIWGIMINLALALRQVWVV